MHVLIVLLYLSIVHHCLAGNPDEQTCTVNQNEDNMKRFQFSENLPDYPNLSDVEFEEDYLILYSEGYPDTDPGGQNWTCNYALLVDPDVECSLKTIDLHYTRNAPTYSDTMQLVMLDDREHVVKDFVTVDSDGETSEFDALQYPRVPLKAGKDYMFHWQSRMKSKGFKFAITCQSESAATFIRIHWFIAAFNALAAMKFIFYSKF